MALQSGSLLFVGLWFTLFAMGTTSNLKGENATIPLTEILNILTDIKSDMGNGIYEQTDSVEFEKKLRDVNALIDIAAINKEKCTQQFFGMVYSRLKGEFAHHENLMSYLMHNRQEQLKLCKTVLDDSVQQLSGSEAQHLLDLKNEIITSKKDALEVSMSGEKVAQGLASYLELNADLQSVGDAANLRQKIRTEVEHLIAVGCNKLMTGTGQMGDIRLFLDSEELIRVLDQYTLDWVATERICHFIGSNLDSVLDSALRATLKRAQGPSTDDCSQLYEQLLTTTAARSTVRPQQVIEFLDILIQVCGSRADEASIERARMGQLLKEFQVINKVRCAKEKFEEIAQYRGLFRQGTVLEGYLLDTRDELVKLCAAPVAEMASHLDKQVLQDMTIISANIAGGVALNPTHLQIPPEQVRFGLNRLLTGLKLVVPEEQLASEFSTKLHNACQATTLILGQLKDLYLSLANYSGLHLDETMQIWLTHYQVCNSITPMMVSSVVMDANNAGSKIYDKFVRRRGF